MTTFNILFGATEAVDSTRFPGTQSHMSTVTISYGVQVGPLKLSKTVYATAFADEASTEEYHMSVTGPDLDDALASTGLELTSYMSKPTDAYPEPKQFFRLAPRS